MTGLEKLENLIKSSKGVITSRLADVHGIHSLRYCCEYINHIEFDRFKKKPNIMFMHYYR